MPSNKPQLSIRLEHAEYDLLKKWVDEDFLPTPCQVAKVMLKKAIKLRQQGQF